MRDCHLRPLLQNLLNVLLMFPLDEVFLAPQDGLFKLEPPLDGCVAQHNILSHNLDCGVRIIHSLLHALQIVHNDLGAKQVRAVQLILVEFFHVAKRLFGGFDAQVVH